MIKIEFDEDQSRLTLYDGTDKIAGYTFENLMLSQVDFIKKILDYAFTEGKKETVENILISVKQIVEKSIEELNDKIEEQINEEEHF